jgi:hypothetical protein
MRITLADKVVAYLALISGLTISAVAIWYSVAGLVSIFAAAVVPIIVMGVVLEVSKLIATVWLKINWHRAPIFIRTYLLIAIAILMVITSMGIFGFLSKAHSDAGLVSGDVQARIAIYDEKIKTARENIDANRKALKQMDEAVDQVMARSSSETGADKAVALRRSQFRERARLQSEIQTEQKAIVALNEERAPIAAEVRKVEAEVGPIKYIANFIYGNNPDANILEKAVTWVIIIIVAVFDPLAVILLLASQYSFQWFRQSREEQEHTPDPYATDAGVKPTEEELNDSEISTVEELAPEEKSILSHHPYLSEPFVHFKDLQPMVYKAETTTSIDKEVSVEKEVTAATAEEIIDEGLKYNTVANSNDNYPENPERGHRTVVMVLGHPRNMIFNGQNWVNADESNPEAIHALDEEAKKKSYIIREQGEQVKKTLG